MPSFLFMPTRSAQAFCTAEHAGMHHRAKAVFPAVPARIGGPRSSHARAPFHAKAAFSAAHASAPCSRFGVSVATRLAKGRDAQAQSGRLSCGSLLTAQQRQSATRLRLVGRPSCGGQRTGFALPASTSVGHNLRQSNQEGVVMCRPSICSVCQGLGLSTPSPSLACLTGRSRGRSYSCSPCVGQVGAPYL